MTVITSIDSNKKGGGGLIGRLLNEWHSFGMIAKDKTIKSPVIQTRYACSNWCVALWRPQANVDLAKSEAGLVNMESPMKP